MSDFRRIRFERVDGLVTLTLNRPEKRNALDATTVEELHQALHAVSRDDDARVVLLRGEGPAFCAGADLAELERIAAGGDPLENLADAGALGELFIRLRRMDRPIIAAVHGQAFAGGAGLATACDLIVASEDALFGYPEVHLGFVPAMVMAILRRQCGEKVAFELVARGERITARQAQEIGLVNRVFTMQTFHDDAREYAMELASRPTAAVRLIKRLFYGTDGLAFEDAIGRGAEVNVLARMTTETREGVRHFLERRGREP